MVEMTDGVGEGGVVVRKEVELFFVVDEVEQPKEEEGDGSCVCQFGAIFS